MRFDKNGNIDTFLYRKPIDIYKYVLFNFAHPLSCKSEILYSQFLPIQSICTNFSDFDRKSTNMSVAFLNQRYSLNLVSETLKKARNIIRATLMLPKGNKRMSTLTTNK